MSDKVPPEVLAHFEDDEKECIHINAERFGEHRFTLEGEIGSGAQAQVHKAQRINAPHDIVAIKVFSCDPRHWGLGESSLRTRFREEARIWHEFESNPYVVPLLDTFLDLCQNFHTGEWELFYGFVMPLASEGDLAKFLKRHPGFLKRSKKETISFLLHIARAIKTGHDKDLCHADIKPHNILVFRDGTIPHPKVMDFGMAMPGTADGVHFGYGTPEYLAPEQFLSSSRPTKEADVYALGVLFYEMIAGERPFQHQRGENDKERWNYYQRQHHMGLSLDHQRRIDSEGGTGAWDLIAGMTAKNVEDRRKMPMANVIKRLELMLEEERFRSVRDPESEALIRPKRYRWHPSVHRRLGNTLCYIFMKGRQPLSDPSWIMNNLRDAGLHGFSLYRVLGGFDYLLRIWIKLSYLDRLQLVIQNFRDSQSGHVMRFDVDDQNILDLADVGEADSILQEDETDSLLQDILKCADADPEKEREQLVASNFALGVLERNESYPLRFFLTIHTSEPIHAELGEAYAHKYRAALRRQNFAKAVSTYIGKGAFALMIKFRLAQYSQFREVIDLIQRTGRGLGNGSVFISTQTFLEVDERGIVESDDGSIIAEVNRVGDQ